MRGEAKICFGFAPHVFDSSRILFRRSPRKPDRLASPDQHEHNHAPDKPCGTEDQQPQAALRKEHANRLQRSPGVAHGAAWGALPQQVLLAAAYTIILATVVTYSLNYYALGKVPSSQVALFIYLQPLIATSTSIAVGRDVLTLRLMVSAALILGGIALTALSYRDESKDSANPS